MNCKVSIIIPAYNAEKTLRRCLDSVLAQDFDDFEVILVNDGSKDRTLDIGNEYTKHPAVILVDQKNWGASRARWAGISASNGEYIGFVDADDCITKSMFSKLYAKAKKTDADIAVCNWATFGQIDSTHLLFKEATIDDFRENLDKIIFRNMNGHMWNKLFRRELLTHSSFQKTFGINYCEDLLLMVSVIPGTKRITYLPEPLYYRFIHPSSITGAPSKETLENLLSVHDSIYAHFRQEKDDFLARSAPKLYIQGLIDLAQILCRRNSPGEKRYELRQEVRRRLAGIPLNTVLDSRPRLITLIKLLLLKHGCYEGAYSLWKSRLFKPVRFIKQRFSGQRSGKNGLS